MKRPLQRRWMFMAFQGLRAVGRWLPLPVAQATGRLAGVAAYALRGRERALSFAHLRYALGPSVSDWTCHRVARGAFINLGKNALEWLVLDRLSPSSIRRLVEVQGLPHLERALQKGRGVIALSAHFGNWELLAITLACRGFDGGVLARRLRNPEYERFLWTMRANKGVDTFARGSVAEVARLLRANQIIGMMPDQDIDSLEGVFVDFFGHPTYTPVGPAALALMTGATLLPCFLVRTGRRFRIHIEEPIPVVRSDDRTRDLLDITQAWSRVVESYIRRYPDHWVWMHRRWKTQPKAAISNQPAPAGTPGGPGQSAVHTTVQQPQATTQTLQPVVSFILAAGCWLLAAGIAGCAKPKPPDVPAPPSVTEEAPAARQMDRFTIAGYNPNGDKRWELEGNGAVADGMFVTIQEPDAIGYDMSAMAGESLTKRTTYLTASLALVNQTTRRVRLEHDVTIHTSDGLWLATPILYWLPDTQEMVTDAPARVETDHMLLRGRGMTGYSQLKTAVFQRDIELVLNPSADESAGGRSHVTITCDGPLIFDYQGGIATFERNVHVNDAQGDLYSDTLIAYVDQRTRTIRYADAIGHVRIVQGANTAHGEHAVYEPAKAKVTLLGAPSLLIYQDQPPTAAPVSMPLLPPTAGEPGQPQAAGAGAASSAAGAQATPSAAGQPAAPPNPPSGNP